jgi:hypothetical protein
MFIFDIGTRLDHGVVDFGLNKKARHMQEVKDKKLALELAELAYNGCHEMMVKQSELGIIILKEDFYPFEQLPIVMQEQWIAASQAVFNHIKGKEN